MRHQDVFDGGVRSSVAWAVGLAAGLVGWVLLWSAPAWAASPPTAVTGAASAVTRTMAVLNGTVNPEGAEATYYFEYGTSPCDTASGTCGVRSASWGPIAGSSATAVESIGVRRLEPGATYHFWVTATSAAGTVHGAEATFETLAAEEYVFEKNLEGYTFGSLAGVAVNQANGDVYAADFGSSPAAVEQFNAAGVWQSSVEIPAVGGNYSQVAVDNSGIPGHEGDVYVADEAEGIVYKYDPKGGVDPGDEGALAPDGSTSTIGAGVLNLPTGVAVGPTGDVYVASEGSLSVAEFSPMGGVINEHFITGLPKEPEERSQGEGSLALAVNAAGGIYVDVAPEPRNPYFVEELGTIEYTSEGLCVDPSCTPIKGFERGIAVDSAGDVFVSDQFGPGYGHEWKDQVQEYGATGGSPLIENPELEAYSPGTHLPNGHSENPHFGVFGEMGGLAVDDASRALYVAEKGGTAVKVFTPDKVQPPVVESGPATEVGGVVAVLNGTVDPEGGEPTEYYFEYGAVPCDVAVGTCGAEAVESGAVPLRGEAGIAVALRLDGLKPNTTYHYWIAGANANSGVQHGEEQTFTTGPLSAEPPGVGAPSSAPAVGGVSVEFPALGGVAPVSSSPAGSVVGAPKSLTRAQRLARALKACTREPHGRRRSACEARARRRYGPLVKAKKTNRGSGR